MPIITASSARRPRSSNSVVQATEAATSDILECAERIQEIAWTLARAGARRGGLRPARCQGDRGLHRLLVPGPHRPAHPQGDRRAALSRRPHQCDDRDLGARRRACGGGRRKARGCRRQGAAQRAGEAGAGARSGRRRHGDGAGGGFTHRKRWRAPIEFVEDAVVEAAAEDAIEAAAEDVVAEMSAAEIA